MKVLAMADIYKITKIAVGFGNIQHANSKRKNLGEVAR